MPQQICIGTCQCFLNKCVKCTRIVNINKFRPQCSSVLSGKFYSVCMLTTRLHFMQSLTKNQSSSIRVCCSFSHLILNTCFAKKDSNQVLALLSSDHFKYLLISYLSKLCEVTTFERDRSGISHLRKSACPPMSYFVFLNSAKYIWWSKKIPTF